MSGFVGFGMRLSLAIVALSALGLAACEPAGPKGVDADALNETVGNAIGDPNTCVLLVEKGSGKVVYRYGSHTTCLRPLPACSAPGTLTPEDLGKLAASGDARTVSCESNAETGGRVGWASGPVVKSPGAEYGDLAFAAVMEGPTVLPGREISVRVQGAFRKAGM